MNIILCEENEVSEGAGVLEKRDGRAVHLMKMLHKKEGGSFDAGIWGGKRGTGFITRIDETGRVFFTLNLTEDAPARLPITFLVGFPRPIQLRRLLRDLSSMGIAEIILAGSDLGDKNYRDTTLLQDGGSRAALREGAIQSRDTTLPTLKTFPTMDAALAALTRDNAFLRICADNVGAAGSFASFSRLAAKKSGAIIAIGSERGWSERERALFDAAAFTRLSLGSRALRTETACVAAAAHAALAVFATSP